VSHHQNIGAGNGSRLSIVATGTSYFTPRAFFYLNNVLVSPHILKSLISIRNFSRDNSVALLDFIHLASLRRLANR
jgi:hypothetical protein